MQGPGVSTPTKVWFTCPHFHTGSSWLHEGTSNGDQKAIPQLSRMFTGRNDILQRLAHDLDPSISSVALKKQRTFVLYGGGGTGKTQIMAKFVDEFGDQYDINTLNRH